MNKERSAVENQEHSASDEANLVSRSTFTSKFHYYKKNLVSFVSRRTSRRQKTIPIKPSLALLSCHHHPGYHRVRFDP
jgi:hypothetical protein